MTLRLPVSMIAAALLVCAQAAQAACPPHELDREREGELIARLQEVPDAGAARELNDKLWRLWTDAPDDRAQNLLDSGMARMRMGDLRNAEKVFDSLVEYCPDFAEGYNQRAFTHYLRHDFGPALADLEAALELNPRHIGALSGKALTLTGLGRDREALDALERALALNPHLAEKSLLPVLKERVGAEEL